MAQMKVQRQKVVGARAKSPSGATARVEPQTLDGWRQECERLRAELLAAREEVASLRTRQEQVLNRIDWVLDALDSLPDSDS